jgi:hypothetical protein
MVTPVVLLCVEAQSSEAGGAAYLPAEQGSVLSV